MMIWTRMRGWRYLWHELRMAFDRRYHQKYEAGLHDTIRWLVDHPEEPIEWE